MQAAPRCVRYRTEVLEGCLMRAAAGLLQVLGLGVGS